MVDPTLLNEQKSKKKSEDEKTSLILRTIVFSVLGALAGAFVCVMTDYFVGNITGLIYLFIGMTTCAFYMYFIDKKDQNKMHIIILIAACILISSLAVFISSGILYSDGINEPDMNILEKTFELYRQNIRQNGFLSYKHESVGDNNIMHYDMSLLAFHLVCTIMSLIGLALSLVFVRLTSNRWDKKHHGEKANYSYSSRVKRSKRKKKK